nr:pentatricopeptide repeat-containing protein [Tanacetum cinerariifolium]
FYKSEKTKINSKCGSRPEMLKEPEKGTQRKWKRYPSTSAGEGSNCACRCYGKEMTEENSFQVISMDDEHTCDKYFKYGNLVNYKWIVENGFSKCSNSVLLRVRNKPLITMLEAMRVIVLERMNTMRKCWSHGVNTYVQTYGRGFENGFSKCSNLVLLRVRNKPLITMLEAMRVIVLERTNTMRKCWSHGVNTYVQTYGRGCEHLFEVRNGSQAFRVDGSIELVLVDCGSFKYLTPVGGMDFWPDSNEMSRVLPPKLKKCLVDQKRKGLGLDMKIKTQIGFLEATATQSSQAQDITPHVVVLDISPRPRSERILNRKLEKNPSRIDSSNSNSLDLE